MITDYRLFMMLAEGGKAGEPTAAQQAAIDRYTEEITRSYRTLVRVDDLEDCLERLAGDPDSESWAAKLKGVQGDFEAAVAKRFGKETMFKDPAVARGAAAAAWKKIRDAAQREVEKSGERADESLRAEDARLLLVGQGDRGATVSGTRVTGRFEPDDLADGGGKLGDAAELEWDFASGRLEVTFLRGDAVSKVLVYRRKVTDSAGLDDALDALGSGGRPGWH